ncbi:hypothetical protein WMF37_50005 [Sorangium sp. So ce291]|uniref:hypothetical protein n=1 Tax=Sorangium sp. So ce291 TaxID=3133294 RepID=UPI003F60718E
MNTLRKIQAGVGLALVSALAFVTASASADNVSPASDDASREAGLQCTMSSGFTPTGREWGYVSLTRTPGICKRIRVGGAAPADFPSCHQRARNELGCYTVVD